MGIFKTADKMFLRQIFNFDYCGPHLLQNIEHDAMQEQWIKKGITEDKFDDWNPQKKQRGW